jgi:hypothetical protein
MRRISIAVAAIISIFFQACSGKEPQHNEVVGTWTNPDGATVVLVDNGEFTAKSFPAEYVLLPKDSFRNQKFDGSGKWTLRKGQAQWEVYLDFNRFSDRKYACSFPLLVAGKKGVLENEPPWYFFLWKEEEGGQRYTFDKK